MALAESIAMRASLTRVLTFLTLLVPAVAGCNGTTRVADSDDAGSDDSGSCSSSSIAFDLDVDSTDPVYYSGGSDPGWGDSFACGGWLAISPAGGSPLKLDQHCFHSCPRAQAAPATNLSFTWDGTTYPFPDGGPTYNGVCNAVCAAPGNYVATICVGYAGADAGTSAETAPPTCKQVPFVWPPPAANAMILETITPTLDGG